MKKIFVLCILFQSQLFAQNNLLKDFQTPPNAAKPRVWWHWMNGNISKEGIQKDLDWMKSTGIGGFQNFDAALFTPIVVPEKIIFMTPAWKDAFKFTTDLAKKNGLEMAIAGSPGWSVTGGPWVEPKDGMKKYVWSDMPIKGGQVFKGKLPPATDVSGKFQDIENKGGGMNSLVGKPPHFYKDTYMIAFKLSENEKHLPELNPIMTVSGGDFDVKKLLDHDLSNYFEIPPTEVGQDMYIQYAFDTPQTFKAFAVAGASEDPLAEFNGVPLNRSLKVSDDGVNFRLIKKLSGSNVPFNTVSMPSTTARYWRMCFETLKPSLSPMLEMMGMVAGKPKGVKVSEFVLFNTSRIDQWEDKAGFSPWTEEDLPKGEANEEAIQENEIIDLSSKIDAEGNLNWEVPPGEWMLVRFGYTLTGRQNHPASPEAAGLEVDKLDKDAVRRYINTYLDLYQNATGNLLGPKGLEYMVLDSYEAGHMNWTENMAKEFEKRRGYSLFNWLPVLVGRVVKSTEASEKFLWDFRKTIGEMIAENHYDVIGEELKKRGMKRYTESHENKRIYLADGMDVKKNADIPMAAMWTPGSLAAGPDEEVRSEADIREAASVANIYGKPFVAAESMTSVGKPFQEYPEKLKRTADMELASGLNRFVIHTSVHQPLDKGPGFSLGPFGQYFSRLETWSGAGAKAWMDYLCRSSHMLQQGKNVADILYLYGENTNITWVCREKLPNIPTGLEFDFINATGLIQDIASENKKLVAPSGNSYQVLMLDESTQLMTMPVLEKIGKLAKAGIKIIGNKPKASPSLADNAIAFSKLANEVWALPNVGPKVNTGLIPDVVISETSHKILFRHRSQANGTSDIYWLNNRNAAPTQAKVSFRVLGKVPELWNAQTGKTEKLSYEIKNGRTIVPLNFESWDAYFVVFKDKASTNKFVKPSKTETLLTTLNQPWKVYIGTKNISMAVLSSLSEQADKDIKYFSGTANYYNAFELKTLKPNVQYVLDLDEVNQLAEVLVNGKNMGTVWKQPFKIDISSALKTGENNIEIRVTNTWVNRLIGDAQADAIKSTFTTMPFYKANAPLIPSGLVGVVKVLEVK